MISSVDVCHECLCQASVTLFPQYTDKSTVRANGLRRLEMATVLTPPPKERFHDSTVGAASSRESWGGSVPSPIAAGSRSYGMRGTGLPDPTLADPNRGKGRVMKEKKTERTPEDKERRAALMVIFFTVFIDLVGFGIIIPVLQPLALEYGASEFEAGLLLGVFSMVQFFFTPVWGWLSDRLGRRPVILVSLLGTSISYIVLGLATNLTWLFVGRLFAGLFSGNIAVASAYISDVTTPEKRAHGMGMIGVAFGLGFICGPAIGGILSHFSLSLPAFAAAAASAIALAVGAAKLKESYKPTQPPDWRKMRHPILDLSKVIENKMVMAIVTANLLWSISFSMWETVFVLFVGSEMLPMLAKEDLAKTAGYMFAYIGLLSAIVQGGMIRQLTKRYSEGVLAKWGIALSILGTLGFVGYVLWFSGSGVVEAIPAMTLVALGMGLVHPTFSSIVSKLVGPDRQGEVLGAFRGMGSLGRVIGPVSGAYLFGEVNHLSPYVLGALLLVGSFLLLMREFRFHSG